MRAGKIIERIRHMLKVKDCKHVCLFCEYYDMCKEEAKANEHEICKISWYNASVMLSYQPHRKEAIHENDRTGTSHQNPASEKNVSDKRAKRET